MKTLKFKHTILLTSTLSLASCLMALSEAKALIITEIMYDTYSEYEDDYDWIEVYNEGDTDVDISGFVFDTNVSQFFHGEGYLPENSIIPKGTAAIIYGSVVRDPLNDWGSKKLKPLSSIWDPDSTRNINFIPVIFPDCSISAHAPYCALYLGQGKRNFGLWDPQSWDEYGRDFSKAAVVSGFENRAWDANSLFPESNNSASIYLTDLSADPNDGSNWALSTVGVDGAYAIEANTFPGTEPGVDIGSPGYIPNDPENVPEPLTILGSITALGFGGLFKRKFSKKNLNSTHKSHRS